jgi:hypothetical protein
MASDRPHVGIDLPTDEVALVMGERRCYAFQEDVNTMSTRLISLLAQKVRALQTT